MSKIHVIRDSGTGDITREYVQDLLQDRTTGKTLVYATDSYEGHKPEDHMDAATVLEDLYSGKMRYGFERRKEEQEKRKKGKAEVFTPSWVVNDMNNFLAADIFGTPGVFNEARPDHAWITNPSPIPFKSYTQYDWFISKTEIEITCGEAPYLVSRYDTTTGEKIDIKDRIGLLDRKLRAINENIEPEDEEAWFEDVKRAYKSTYGYEYQGDNLFFARQNLLETFIDYYIGRFAKLPTIEQHNEIVDIITWNIWQMDGLKSTLPTRNDIFPVIKDWKTGEIFEFRSITEKEETR